MKTKTLKMGACGLAAALLGGALIYYNAIYKTPEDISGNCPPYTAQTFAYTDGEWALDGGVVTNADMLGNITVLNFWETWCAACVQEMPIFNQIQNDYADSGVKVMAMVGTTSSAAAAATWLNKGSWTIYEPNSDWKTFSLTVAWLPQETCKDLGCVGMLPRTVIVDKAGDIAYQQNGSMHYEQLAEIIEDLL